MFFCVVHSNIFGIWSTVCSLVWFVYCQLGHVDRTETNLCPLELHQCQKAGCPVNIYSLQFPALSHENSSTFIVSGVHDQRNFCIIYFILYFLSLKLFACCYAAAQNTDRLCRVIFTDWTLHNITLTSLLSKSKVIKQPMQHEAQQKWHQRSFISTPHHMLFETWEHLFEQSRNEQKRIRTDMRSVLLY